MLKIHTATSFALTFPCRQALSKARIKSTYSEVWLKFFLLCYFFVVLSFFLLPVLPLFFLPCLSSSFSLSVQIKCNWSFVSLVKTLCTHKFGGIEGMRNDFKGGPEGVSYASVKCCSTRCRRGHVLQSIRCACLSLNSITKS